MSESNPDNPSQLSTKLEAILYLKAQPLSIQELADYAICEIDDIEEALLELMQDYAQRNSALEVVESDAGFSLQLREAYMSLVQTIVPTDLGVAALRTLAAIALKGPIPQTQLVELRGSGAYQHVGDLVEEGFVSKRRQSNGRSYSVQVTEKFYQYFEVDELPKLKLKKTARQRRVVEEDDPPENLELPLETKEDQSSNEDAASTDESTDSSEESLASENQGSDSSNEGQTSEDEGNSPQDEPSATQDEPPVDEAIATSPPITETQDKADSVPEQAQETIPDSPQLPAKTEVTAGSDG